MAVSKKMAAAKNRAKKEQEPTAKGSQAVSNLDEKIMMEALSATKEEEGLSAGDLVVQKNQRKALIAKAGFDYIDVRDLTPNKENSYSIDEASIESLASLILESKNTTPLIVRDVEGGRQIVDGERRYRAHLLLGERYGEHWYMAPARVFPIGTLSDEDATFMLHAENVGQRNMTPSERAQGVAIVTDRILARRKNDPNFAKGKKTKEIIAEQFGVSERTAVIEANIGRNLGEAGRRVYDAGQVTKQAAEAISRLPEEEQEDLVQKIESGEIAKSEVQAVAQGREASSSRIPRHVDEDLKEARRALKRALKKGEKPDRVIIAELWNLLEKIDPTMSIEKL